MGNLRTFIKSYWDYYIEIEAQFLESKKFVAFDKANYKTFSVEYLKLYQAVCSETDVVGKEIACAVDSSFKIDNYTNIKKWGYAIQQYFPELKDVVVIFNDEIEVQPFLDWEYEAFITKDGKNCLRIVDGKNTITWWNNYNKVKHQRIGLVTDTNNFCLANQNNLILAYAALYAIEITYINRISDDIDVKIEPSKLFKLKG